MHYSSLLMLGLGGYLMTMDNKKVKSECLFGFGGSSSKESDKPIVLKRDTLAGRCKAILYAANWPNQDKLAVQ